MNRVRDRDREDRDISVDMQTHVHEFSGSTRLAPGGESRHNHRIAGVTGEVVYIGDRRHVHHIMVNTDFFDHHHEVGVTTGPDLPLPGSGHHIHPIRGRTSVNDGHFHDLISVTAVDAPLTVSGD